MVLYRVHSEPLLGKYYSTVCSKATLFQVVIYSLIIIPPFFIAYATNDFWQYTSSYREQPSVHFLRELIVQVGEGGAGGGGSQVWSSFSNLNLLLQPEELVTPIIRSREDDINRDGKKDILYLNLEFSDLGQNVTTVQLLLFFQVQLSLFSSLTMQSLVHTSQSWSAPVTRLWVGGGVELRQRVPLPATGRVEQYNTSLFNANSSFAADYDISNILSRYNARNVRTILSEPYVVWESGNSGNFTIELELRYPPQTITYAPGFWQLIKFAWVQYLAVLVVFWWVLSHVQSFVFENQIILTLRHNTNKLHKH